VTGMPVPSMSSPSGSRTYSLERLSPKCGPTRAVLLLIMAGSSSLHLWVCFKIVPIAHDEAR